MSNGTFYSLGAKYLSHYGRKGMKWGKNIFGEDDNPITTWRREAQKQTSRPSSSELWRRIAAQQRNQSTDPAEAWKRAGQAQSAAQRKAINREIQDIAERNVAARSAAAVQKNATMKALLKDLKTANALRDYYRNKQNVTGPNSYDMAKRAENHSRADDQRYSTERRAAVGDRITNTNGPKETAVQRRDWDENKKISEQEQANLRKAYGSAIAANNAKAAEAIRYGSTMVRNDAAEQMKREEEAFKKSEETFKRSVGSVNKAWENFEKKLRTLSEEEFNRRWEHSKQSDATMQDALEYLCKKKTGMSVAEYARKNRQANKRSLRNTIEFIK